MYIDILFLGEGIRILFAQLVSSLWFDAQSLKMMCSWRRKRGKEGYVHNVPSGGFLLLCLAGKEVCCVYDGKEATAVPLWVQEKGSTLKFHLLGKQSNTMCTAHRRFIIDEEGCVCALFHTPVLLVLLGSSLLISNLLQLHWCKLQMPCLPWSGVCECVCSTTTSLSAWTLQQFFVSFELAHCFSPPFLWILYSTPFAVFWSPLFDLLLKWRSLHSTHTGPLCDSPMSWVLNLGHHHHRRRRCRRCSFWWRTAFSVQRCLSRVVGAQRFRYFTNLRLESCLFTTQPHFRRLSPLFPPLLLFICDSLRWIGCQSQMCCASLCHFAAAWRLN